MPSAFIVYISRWSRMPATGVTRRWNAMRSPLGDQVALVTLTLLGVMSKSKFVSLICSEPSAFITQISGLPLRLLSNAILSPFGDHAGFVSEPVASVSRTTSVSIGVHHVDFSGHRVPVADECDGVGFRRPVTTKIVPVHTRLTRALRRTGEIGQAGAVDVDDVDIPTGYGLAVKAELVAVVTRRPEIVRLRKVDEELLPGPVGVHQVDLRYALPGRSGSVGRLLWKAISFFARDQSGARVV